MRNLFFLFVLVGILGLTAAAAPLPDPCVLGTLDEYVALGSTGCSVGSAVFSNFMPLAVMMPVVYIHPNLDAVGLEWGGAPVNGDADAGVIEVPAGERAAWAFAYDVTASLIRGISFKTYRADGTMVLTKDVIGGDGETLQLQVTNMNLDAGTALFRNPQTMMTVIDTVEIDASNGAAVLGISEQNVVVPEPAAFLLLGPGLLALAMLRRRSRP